jgi:catechol 2,3-dioxygenase-like lactoylglutathione lyase family enzyme
MELGAFSVSLAVKDLAASRTFYEALGFEVVGGEAEQNWLILRNGNHTIGLQGPHYHCAMARRGLCGRRRVGLSKRSSVVPNKCAQTVRSPRKGPSRRVLPESPHLTRFIPRPWRWPLSLGL